MFNDSNTVTIGDYDYYISYSRLFTVLNDCGKCLSDLRNVVSPKVVAKFARGKCIHTSSILKVCLYLGCQPGDIMEIKKFVTYERSKV